MNYSVLSVRYRKFKRILVEMVNRVKEIFNRKIMTIKFISIDITEVDDIINLIEEENDTNLYHLLFKNSDINSDMIMGFFENLKDELELFLAGYKYKYKVSLDPIDFPELNELFMYMEKEGIISATIEKNTIEKNTTIETYGSTIVRPIHWGQLDPVAAMRTFENLQEHEQLTYSDCKDCLASLDNSLLNILDGIDKSNQYDPEWIGNRMMEVNKIKIQLEEIGFSNDQSNEIVKCIQCEKEDATFGCDILFCPKCCGMPDCMVHVVSMPSSTKKESSAPIIMSDDEDDNDIDYKLDPHHAWNRFTILRDNNMMTVKECDISLRYYQMIKKKINLGINVKNLNYADIDAWVAMINVEKSRLLHEEDKTKRKMAVADCKKCKKSKSETVYDLCENCYRSYYNTQRCGVCNKYNVLKRGSPELCCDSCKKKKEENRDENKMGTCRQCEAHTIIDCTFLLCSICCEGCMKHRNITKKETTSTANTANTANTASTVDTANTASTANTVSTVSTVGTVNTYEKCFVCSKENSDMDCTFLLCDKCCTDKDCPVHDKKEKEERVDCFRINCGYPNDTNCFYGYCSRCRHADYVRCECGKCRIDRAVNFSKKMNVEKEDYEYMNQKKRTDFCKNDDCAIILGDSTCESGYCNECRYKICKCSPCLFTQTTEVVENDLNKIREAFLSEEETIEEHLVKKDQLAKRAQLAKKEMRCGSCGSMNMKIDGKLSYPNWCDLCKSHRLPVI